MWITIYFKSGRITETLIHSFGELDDLYNKEDIIQIHMGCTMLDENREKQQEIINLKIKLLRAEEERLNGQGMSIDEVRARIGEEN